jgi:hypothetical protein
MKSDRLVMSTHWGRFCTRSVALRPPVSGKDSSEVIEKVRTGRIDSLTTVAVPPSKGGTSDVSGESGKPRSADTSSRGGGTVLAWRPWR